MKNDEQAPAGGQRQEPEHPNMQRITSRKRGLGQTPARGNSKRRRELEDLQALAAYTRMQQFRQLSGDPGLGGSPTKLS